MPRAVPDFCLWVGGLRSLTVKQVRQNLQWQMPFTPSLHAKMESLMQKLKCNDDDHDKKLAFIEP